MKKVFLLLFLFFLHFAHADFNSVIAYHEYVSPNKNYVAQVSIRKRDSILVIKNKKSGIIESSITDLLSPILDIQWAPHSNSFIVIQHLAGCSLASLVTSVNDAWKKYDCEPSLKNQYRYSVLDVNFLKNVVRLTYGVSQQQKGNNEPLNFNLVVLDANDKTGSISLRKTEPLSINTFVKLRKKKKKIGFLSR